MATEIKLTVEAFVDEESSVHITTHWKTPGDMSPSDVPLAVRAILDNLEVEYATMMASPAHKPAGAA